MNLLFYYFSATISNECEKIYLKECASAGIEAGKLR
jgi:hypothetical protein